MYQSGGVSILKKRHSQSKLFLILVVFIALVSIIVAANTLNNAVSDAPSQIQTLASTVNNIPIDTPEIEHYLEVNNYFEDILYEKVSVGKTTQAKLTVGNKQDNIKGFEINDKRYAVHLLACDYNLQRCFFRINGVPTKELHVYKSGEPETHSSFNLDDSHKIRIESIIFDYCDNRRFCNLFYEAYDIVNLSVMPR